jgi:hypothetical protein
MKTQIKYANDNDMVHAVIRMSTAEYQKLKAYMHCEKKEHIEFPYGAYITIRGRGWYRLVSNNDVRAAEKVQFALTCINRFLAEEEAATVEQLKLLMPSILTNTKLAAFSNYHSQRDLTYLGERQPPKPASMNQLQRLAQKFNN